MKSDMGAHHSKSYVLRLHEPQLNSYRRTEI
nr:MAG TPA: hypothetical protein [Caudoviricetes sp.]